MTTGHEQREGRPADLTVRRVQEIGVSLALWGTRSAAFAAAVEGGIRMEQWYRRGLSGYRKAWSNVLGYASAKEVAELRELVRALEHRIEVVEPAPPAAPSRPTKRGTRAQ